MPTYVYRREDGTKFEIKQRITDEPLEECPETGQPVERIIAGSAGLIFKGDGFYITDYKDGSNGGDKSSTSPSATESSSETETSETASTEASASE
ncbi:FmdB family transcriptional regulator [Longibacter salinarum]|uniref:FmdB family transcriptional regulator n=1 Tax=Longibacter salinarum TaxID=1850348 RepID=A0A2A8D0U6_9BACT|nr:FmdB family zinc ribbon protein [Longibacter salinarum]PEN14546.1 FmdB family transcriptional regulator [Longibacter salinarum]